MVLENITNRPRLPLDGPSKGIRGDRPCTPRRRADASAEEGAGAAPAPCTPRARAANAAPGTPRARAAAGGGGEAAPRAPRAPSAPGRALPEACGGGAATARGRAPSASRGDLGAAAPPRGRSAEAPPGAARGAAAPGGGRAAAGGEKGAWANALWDQKERHRELGERLAEARRAVEAARARAAAGARAAEGHRACLEQARQSHAGKMEELRERQARMVEELRTLRADLEAEAGKGARMRAGIQAKAHELARDGQQLARLRAKHRSLMDEGEANVEWERSLSAATAAAEEALAARGELRAQGVVKARQLHNEYLTLKGNIRVFCRVRPPLPSEGEALARLDVREDAGLTVHGESQKSCTGLSEHSAAYDFAFDHVFGPEASQADVFEEIALLVQSALDGYRVAVFAYGQTGGGKTHTMDGPPPEQRTADTAGVIPRTVDLIFSEVEEMRQKGWDFEVYASSMEVYNENVLDMLAPRGSAHLPGAPEQGAAHAAAGPEQFQARRVESASAVHALLRRSARERHTAATACNDRSSRSHAIFQLSIVGRNQSGSCPQEARGLLSLVDLAGSERVERSGATGDRLREAQHINRSLSALGDVIEALARRGQAGGRGEGCHVPYRNSRLTTLLKDSLGGNSKALMFVNVSPCARHLGETLSSLRFAAKVHGCNVGVARRQAAEGPRGDR